MTPSTPDRSETKILMTVAGVVVAGVAGIALLAGLSADRDARAQPARRAAAVRPAYEPVRPASLPVAEPMLEVPMEQRTIEVQPVAEPEAAPEPAFEIDPSANLVAEALEGYAAREFDRAAAYLAAEIDARPGRAWPHYMLGLSLWKAGRLDEAVVAMEQATLLDPTSIKAFVNLSRIQNDRGAFSEALEAADAARAIDSGDASALFLTGRSRLNLGEAEQAIAALESSLAVDPNNGFVQNMLGLALLQEERFDEAAPALRTAAELEPQVAFIQNNLGMALEHQGHGAEALAAYRHAVEIDSAHANAVANVARLEPLSSAVEPPSIAVAESGEAMPTSTPESPARAASDPIEERPSPTETAEDTAVEIAADSGGAGVD